MTMNLEIGHQTDVTNDSNLIVSSRSAILQHYVQQMALLPRNKMGAKR